MVYQCEFCGLVHFGNSGRGYRDEVGLEVEVGDMLKLVESFDPSQRLRSVLTLVVPHSPLRASLRAELHVDGDLELSVGVALSPIGAGGPSAQLHGQVVEYSDDLGDLRVVCCLGGEVPVVQRIREGGLGARERLASARLTSRQLLLPLAGTEF